MEPLLSLRHLSVGYDVGDGVLSAVNNIDLDIYRGEIFALIGESGCGKSTVSSAIMRLLFGEDAHVSGKILFKGRDLYALSEREMSSVRGREISMIFQNPLDSLNPVYRSGRQVKEAIVLDNISQRDAWDKVLELYRDVQIPDAERRMRSFPHELSGGMRQRVMIAMMLSRNPELLIADEPTTALDVTIEAQILDILHELRQRYQTSIMVITHNFGIVAEIADRVGIMYAGELVEIADVFTLFKEPAHPYTKALMQALPRGSKRDGRISTIEGNVPRIVGEYSGCRFFNRCPLADERCRSAIPPQVEITPGHVVRCHKEVC